MKTIEFTGVAHHGRHIYQACDRITVEDHDAHDLVENRNAARYITEANPLDKQSGGPTQADRGGDVRRKPFGPGVKKG
jgi:hypothetical protein